MKKILSTIVSIFSSTLLFIGMLPNCLAANNSQTYTAYPSNNPIYVEGTQINTIPIYNINNSNYFKLRDIGYLMDFGVSWNTSKKCVEINTSKSSDGLQVSTHQATQAKTASISNQPIYIDNVLYKDMTVYKIDDNNYFKLRDLADKVDFSCIYDSTTHSVSLDSRFHYSFKNVRGIKKDLTNYQYYDSYSSVPDFGNITGSSLYLDSGKNEKGIMYWYDIDWDANYDGIAIYKDILKANRFYYRTTVTDDDNQNIDIFEGNGLAIMCGFHQGRYVVYILNDSNSGNTTTIHQYVTYPHYPAVPDFGAFSGALLWGSTGKDHGVEVYGYITTNTPVSELYRYGDALESLGFIKGQKDDLYGDGILYYKKNGNKNLYVVLIVSEKTDQYMIVVKESAA